MCVLHSEWVKSYFLRADRSRLRALLLLRCLIIKFMLLTECLWWRKSWNSSECVFELVSAAMSVCVLRRLNNTEYVLLVIRCTCYYVWNYSLVFITMSWWLRMRWDLPPHTTMPHRTGLRYWLSFWHERSPTVHQDGSSQKSLCWH